MFPIPASAALLWATRGGGGNFGVATEFQYRIHPFDPNPLAGSLTYSFDQAKSVLRNLAEHFETIPDECSIEPGFGVSAEGDRYMYVVVCYAGDHATGEKVVALLRAIGKPSSDTIAPMSYQTLQTSADGYFAQGRQNYLKSSFIRTLAPAAIVDNYEGDFLPDTLLEHLGGAVGRVDATATAFSHRDVIMNYGISGTWDDPAESEQRIAKIREYYSAIEPQMNLQATFDLDSRVQSTRCRLTRSDTSASARKEVRSIVSTGLAAPPKYETPQPGRFLFLPKGFGTLSPVRWVQRRS